MFPFEFHQDFDVHIRQIFSLQEDYPVSKMTALKLNWNHVCPFIPFKLDD